MLSAVTRVAFALVLIGAFAFDAAAQSGYGGPSLLSRGGNRPGRRGRAPIDFNFYVGVRGTAEQGLIAPQLTDEGDIDPVTAYGWSGEVGFYGAHDWRRSSLGADYRGDYRYNARFKGFNGFNHVLSLDYQRQLSSRTGFVIRQTGGTTNRAFGGFAAPAFPELDRFGVPLNEVYDVRTYFSQTSGTLFHRYSARTTLAAQGDGFFVKRQSRALINSQGYTVAGMIGHRISRSTEIGGSYQFLRAEFRRAFAGSDVHSVAAQFRHRVSRNWDVSMTGGAFRISSFGTQRVELSPEVAFILGRTQGISAFQRVLYRPKVEVTGSYTQDRGRFSAGYTAGVGAGNGVYLTTFQHTVRAGYSFAGLRRTSLGVSAGYSRSSSVTIQLGDLSNYQAGIAAGYRLAEHLNLSSQIDYRRFRAPGVTGREGFAATVGLSYTPSRFPIAIW